MKKIFTILGVLAVTSTAFAQELLTNPGFENGFDAWSKGPGGSYTLPVISTTDSHSGSKSAGYTSPSATTGFYQNAPVTAGKTYVITFWYKAGGDDTDARLWSVYKDVDGGPVYTSNDISTDAFRTFDGYLATAAAWTKHTAEMPAGDGAVSLDVAVRAYKNSTVAQFDDFSLVDKATLAVADVSKFDQQVKMNTIVGDELRIILPTRSTVNIYAADGKLVSSDRVNNGEAINTSTLAKGIYIVTVDNGAAKVSRKVMKK